MAKKRGALAILLIAAAAGLGGCTNSGTETLRNPENLRQIHVNHSTKEQVRELLGEPQSITVHSNETETWTYRSTHSSYTEQYAAKTAAKTAVSFVPIPYLGTAVGLADRAIDTGPDKRGETLTLSLTFNKRGILKESRRETKHF